MYIPPLSVSNVPPVISIFPPELLSLVTSKLLLYVPVAFAVILPPDCFKLPPDTSIGFVATAKISALSETLRFPIKT